MPKPDISSKADALISKLLAETENGPEMSNFTREYLIAALWSSNDESTPQGGNPLDQNYSIEDIAPSSVAKAQADCDAFLAKVREAGIEFEKPEDEAAHDFWFTRVGHGVGFWDGDYPENGDRLTEIAKEFGNIDPYVGDDKLIYIE